MARVGEACSSRGANEIEVGWSRASAHEHEDGMGLTSLMAVLLNSYAILTMIMRGSKNVRVACSHICGSPAPFRKGVDVTSTMKSKGGGLPARMRRVEPAFAREAHNVMHACTASVAFLRLHAFLPAAPSPGAGGRSGMPLFTRSSQYRTQLRGQWPSYPDRSAAQASLPAFSARRGRERDAGVCWARGIVSGRVRCQRKNQPAGSHASRGREWPTQEPPPSGRHNVVPAGPVDVDEPTQA
jgi:hypothetical protein